MPQSLACVYLHVVFSTKDRVNFLLDDEVRNRTFEYIGGICRSLGSAPVAIGGMPDHVHISAALSRTGSIAELVKNVKGTSSHWIKSEFPILREFAWQAGYAAYSVDLAGLDNVRRYIEGQEGHHKRETFCEEFLRLLKEHGLRWDERYVWD